MITEKYVGVAQAAVSESAAGFHLRVGSITAACGYEIHKYGRQPFRAGKASPQELQEKLDTVVADLDLDVQDEETLHSIISSYQLGIDCSNFAFRCLQGVYERLGLKSYSDHVFREASEIRELAISKDSWKATLGRDDEETLERSDKLSAGWVARAFGKQPEFIVGAAHITAPEAATPIEPLRTLPGDLIGFKNIATGVVSHLAVVESVNATEDSAVKVDFWHPSSPQGLRPCLRNDTVTIDATIMSWGRAGLMRPDKYQGAAFYRSIGIANLLEEPKR